MPLINSLPGLEPGASEPGPLPDNQESGQRSDNSDDYTAMCLMKRTPRFGDNPSVFFFSASNHSSSSMNCHGAQRIELNISSSIFADDDDQLSADRSWQDVGLMDQENDVKRILLDKESYDGSLDTYFIIHGFLGSWDGDNWMCRLKDMILNNTDANVFVVDWSGGAKPMMPIDYGQAVANIRYVAQLVGEYIKWLMRISGQRDASRFHLIGHSLGAHISGFVGYSLDGSLSSITALDPAGPCFSSAMIERSQGGRLADQDSGDGLSQTRRRLSSDSAKLVIALHTDTSLFGLDENCAHYNVYVNGGSQQPECASTSLSGRLGSLLQLKLGNTLSFDITCAHSFAHKMVDTIAGIAGSELGLDEPTTGKPQDPDLGEKPEKLRFVVGSDDRCFPMAYRCSSWEAFKAGECGYCADNEPRCVFTGLYLGRQRADLLAPPEEEAVNRARSTRLTASSKRNRVNVAEAGDGSNDDDDAFNDEADPAQATGARTLNGMGSPDTFTRNHHFIKTAAQAPTCLYHYQVVIAANSSGSTASSRWVKAFGMGKRKYFYLQIPLNQSGAVLVDANGLRKRDRLIQVSHILKPGSSAHTELSGEPLAALREEYSSSAKLASIEARQLDFYTALISFKSAPLDQESGRCNETALSQKTGAWYLCRPLSLMKEARIWASNRKQLAGVQWVALNYMSGLKRAGRLRRSHLLVPDPEWGIQSVDEMTASLRPSLGELSPTAAAKPGGRNLGDLIRDPTDIITISPTTDLVAPILNTALQPLNCLASSLNPLKSGDSETKCDRTKAGLKYSARLRPIKANSKSKF